MRVVNEIVKPNCKITVFSWNGKYLIKFEQGDLEQTFKIDALDLTSEDEIYDIISDEFINEVVASFGQMRNLFYKYRSL